ncbi:probable LRR receptor-like serine/threonine-protein kinase At1g06840 [Syzygium oleosum]|uniref:probable LRR receptor-like serine/threonine-protein kinase At1g06840 n=1 Tax=Syzygium oleosum TaxID=219896 RepID=UPI0024BAD1D8|nr:probable LRR receptor-like serine/threonine-protein kinase At1g06840 [Syzygium oleosum]XP_056175978.1 probable LRR receptor-like serine/threonine-protein kinase At1g06840 [Syzygium oleosum]XP_056175979.1 probable LRR receptor-like serine/threonine-protein kinase At1g06840 [Syzygium oleosum]
MLHGFGDFCVLHRSKSKVSTYGAFLAICFCLFSLLARAQKHITDPAEVKALQDIKRSLVDPNKNLTNWNRGDPCTSNWTGVLCYNRTLENGYLHVIELQLLNLNLSGTLSPELGRLSFMKILDFMWNNITGSIPKEIGNITSLELLLLNGNHLTGPLPDELGYLPNLDRIQIDQNHISGPIPASFANLNKTKHFHMNNNSLSGQIPPELSRLPSLVHFLLDNNNLSGHLPPEFSELPNLLILQVDNNHFDGTTIPPSYVNMSKLLKMSLRNCSLQGTIPDLSSIPDLGYLDLSSNKLNGSIPTNKLSENITTIDLSNNDLSGTIPANFSGLVNLQRLSLANNSLVGSVPSGIWQNRSVQATARLEVYLQNNRFVNISGSTSLPPNVSVWLQGNPLCSNSNLIEFCQSQSSGVDSLQNTTSEGCPTQSCPPPYEYSVLSTVPCFCALPLLVGYRLKSPGFSYFDAYEDAFMQYMSGGLNLYLYQVQINTFAWEEGPRLRIYLEIFPVSQNDSSHLFNKSELVRIRSMFTGWKIPDSDLFGPYELLNFTLLEPYQEEFPTASSSGISKGALVGIALGAIAGAVTLSAIVSLLIVRKHLRDHPGISKRRQLSKTSIKIDGVKCFSYGEMASATNNFNSSTQVGQGGYGKVYRGILADGTVVAIKRAQEGSLQGEKEFLTEIELLSRLHHRNLVSLLGYCDEEGEQMLIYEFMPNGTLRDHISGRSKDPLSFGMRLRVAIGSAKGILYLHSEADPPIFHRDIKASNILLDSKFTAKVADFGLSRLAPVPDIEGVVPGHVSTVVKGTPGYLDPEYFLTHKLTDKSDVYSLGVVFLELLTGMQPISHGKNIVREVNIAHQSGTTFSIVDGSMGSYPSECVEKFLMLALKCCQDETDARPSMADVVRELESIWLLAPGLDGRTTESFSIEATNKMTPPSSSSEIMNPNMSYDVSGSDLISGVTPTVTPR